MRLSIDIPDELHRRVRVRAAEEGTTASAVVRSLLTNWVIGSWDEAREYHARLEEVSVVEATPENIAAGTRPIKPISKADQAKGKSRK